MKESRGGNSQQEQSTDPLQDPLQASLEEELREFEHLHQQLMQQLRMAERKMRRLQEQFHRLHQQQERGQRLSLIPLRQSWRLKQEEQEKEQCYCQDYQPERQHQHQQPRQKQQTQWEDVHCQLQALPEDMAVLQKRRRGIHSYYDLLLGEMKKLNEEIQILWFDS